MGQREPNHHQPKTELEYLMYVNSVFFFLLTCLVRTLFSLSFASGCLASVRRVASIGGDSVMVRYTAKSFALSGASWVESWWE